MVQPSDYELQRLANMERNKDILRELGLDQPAFPAKDRSRQQKRAVVAKKRKRADTPESTEDREDPSIEKQAKVARKASATPTEDAIPGPRRRSSRNVNKNVDYKGELDRTPKLVAVNPRRSSMDFAKKAATTGTRIHDPYVSLVILSFAGKQTSCPE
jgi:hypothetical protein